jgi:hypothetical protein
MRMTNHACARSQQRGIPQFTIDLLMKFGKTEPVGEGVSKVFFDKAARRRLNAYFGPLASLLQEHLDVYAVLGPNCEVITTAHRTERIRRH